MEKINVAEILRNCPRDMELNCTIYDNLYFNQVYDDYCLYRISCYTIADGIRNTINFTESGTFTAHVNSKCVIFPKGKTTWEGFVPPCKFKDGDVVVAEGKSCQLFLLKQVKYREDNNGYDGYCYFGLDFLDKRLFKEGNWGFNRLATEEERQRLFQAIEEHGYKWNAETKTLEKLIEPKFKVGDKVKRKDVNYTYIITIAKLGGDYYDYVNEGGQCGVIHISKQDDWELVPNKFDISTLKPFDKVLVRDSDSQKWDPELFTFYNNESEDYHFQLVGAVCARYCIPYEENKHLLGTTSDCDDFYKTWE